MSKMQPLWLYFAFNGIRNYIAVEMKNFSKYICVDYSPFRQDHLCTYVCFFFAILKFVTTKNSESILIYRPFGKWRYVILICCFYFLLSFAISYVLNANVITDIDIPIIESIKYFFHASFEK